MGQLRQVKKDRTRAALLDAATRLFSEQGFESTTVTQIAAVAEVGARTFFRYFATKEDLLFPDAEHRVQAALDAIATRHDEEPPAEVLLRALDLAGLTGPDANDALDPLRLRIIRQVPSAAGYALRVQQEAQTRIGAALHAAYPDELETVEAAAMVGAFIGAFASATAAAAKSGLRSAAARPVIRRAVAGVLANDTTTRHP